MNTQELKPCPFCGGRCDIVRGESVSDAWRHGRFWRVFCTKCQVRQLFHKTKKESIKAWNHRVDRNHTKVLKLLQEKLIETTEEERNAIIEMDMSKLEYVEETEKDAQDAINDYYIGGV